jgi:fatty-acyl-CoA synthase
LYPEETEAALAAHPDLLDVAVGVVPDVEFGQRMIAWVVPRAGAALDEANLRTFLRERIERHQLPRSFERIGEIPRNALGKVDRRALEALVPRQEPHLEQ